MPEFLQRLSGAEVVGLISIVSATIVLCILILTIGWATMHATKVQAALKRDMLARNISVEEIERLTQSDQIRLTALQAEERNKQAQIYADLKRDLLAKGLPVEDVIRMTGGSVPGAPNESKTHADAACLAGAIAQMVKGAGSSLDEDAVAQLIELALRRNEIQPVAAQPPTSAPPREERAPMALSDNVRPPLG
jgi:hypothetical protein